MPKFIPYESPSSYLATRIGFIKRLRSLYFKYNMFDDELSDYARDPRSKHSPYFLGGLHPLIAMKKDFVDTFKPYKANFHVARDLVQPVRGVGNLIKGVFNLIAAPIIFLFNIPRYAYKGVFTQMMPRSFVKLGGGLLDGITSILRGITQIAATPLTWLIKMPLRGFITLAKGKPTLSQNLEKQVQKLEELIHKDEKTVEDTIAIDRGIKSIATKLMKAEKRGQKIGVVSFDDAVNVLDNCAMFTEKRLNGRGATEVMFGAVSRDGYTLLPDNSTRVKNKALAFLGVFKGELPVSQEDNPSKSDPFNTCDHVSGRSFI